MTPEVSILAVCLWLGAAVAYLTLLFTHEED